MADASSPNLWVTLLTLGVGGGLTLLGGWLGPYLLEGRKEAADKKKRRTEKFEELVAAVYEFDHWLDRYRSITAFGEEGKVSRFHRSQKYKLSPQSIFRSLATKLRS